MSIQARDELFNKIAGDLRAEIGADWNDWELDWLDAMRRLSRAPSEKERDKLRQLQWLNTSFSRWEAGGLSVVDMIAACHRYAADFSEDDCEFIEALYKSGTKTVWRRQLRRLVRLVRECGEFVGEAEV